MELTENRKIEILSELTSEFPERTDKIIRTAEDLCLKLPDFSHKTEEEKADLVIKTIFETPNLIQEEDYYLLEAAGYLKKDNTDNISETFFVGAETIDKHPFFKKDSVSRAVSENDRQSVEGLAETVLNLIDSFAEVSAAAEATLKSCRNYLTQVSRLPETREIVKLKTELDKRLQAAEKQQSSLNEIYKKNIERLKELDDELIKINKADESQIYTDKIEALKSEFQKIFKEQEVLTAKVQGFELLPVDNILTFPDIINQMSTFFLSYPILLNLLSAEEVNKYGKTEELKVLEETLTSNYKIFNEKVKKLFEKGIMDEKDRVKAFKNKFIEPKRADLGEDSYNVLSKLVEAVL